MKGQMPEFSHGVVWISFISEFFRLATKALEDLGDNLVIEVVHADVISGVPRLVRGELGERPSHFPKEFLRAWLSNVPCVAFLFSILSFHNAIPVVIIPMDFSTPFCIYFHTIHLELPRLCLLW